MIIKLRHLSKIRYFIYILIFNINYIHIFFLFLSFFNRCFKRDWCTLLKLIRPIIIWFSKVLLINLYIILFIRKWYSFCSNIFIILIYFVIFIYFTFFNFLITLIIRLLLIFSLNLLHYIFLILNNLFFIIII